MNKRHRKLKLNRDTIRHLTDVSLQPAKGGYDAPETLESGCYCPSHTDCSACPKCPFRPPPDA